MADHRRLRPLKRYPSIFIRLGKRGRKSYVVMPYDASTGGKAYVGTYYSLDAAREALNTQRQSGGAGGLKGRMQVADFVQNCWLQQFPRPKQSTMDTHRGSVKGFTATFGHLTFRDLQRHEDEVKAWGRACSHAQLNAARAMLYDAVEFKALKENPLARLGRRQPKGRANINVISESDLYGLADAALAVHGEHGPMVRAEILFLAYTCVRPAELVALQKPYLHPAAGKLDVSWSRYRSGELTRPKNGEARTVILPPPAWEPLAALADHESSFVFTNKYGRPLTYSTLYGHLKAVFAYYAGKTGNRNSAGREWDWAGWDPYELRHYGAHYLWQRLGPKYGITTEMVAFQLGHADSELIETLYGHPDHDMWRRTMLDAFDHEARKRRREAEDAAGNVQRLQPA